MYSDFTKIEADRLESKHVPIEAKKALLHRKINSTRIAPKEVITGINRKRVTKFVKHCDNVFMNVSIPFETWKDMVNNQKSKGISVPAEHV
jgi:uridine phosphorylase